MVTSKVETMRVKTGGARPLVVKLKMANAA
jgi:hypothetical protein